MYCKHSLPTFVLIPDDYSHKRFLSLLRSITDKSPAVLEFPVWESNTSNGI